jgi:hypothetical protein
MDCVRAAAYHYRAGAESNSTILDAFATANGHVEPVRCANPAKALEIRLPAACMAASMGAAWTSARI